MANGVYVHVCVCVCVCLKRFRLSAAFL